MGRKIIEATRIAITRNPIANGQHRTPPMDSPDTGWRELATRAGVTSTTRTVGEGGASRAEVGKTVGTGVQVGVRVMVGIGVRVNVGVGVGNPPPSARAGMAPARKRTHSSRAVASHIDELRRFDRTRCTGEFLILVILSKSRPLCLILP